MTLTVDPTELIVPTTGGSVFLNVNSSFEGRAAFKVKISNLELYRVKPVYGFIDPKGTVKIEVLRFIGKGKEEKLVIQWAEVPADETEPQASFKAGAESGEIAIILKPK